MERSIEQILTEIMSLTLPKRKAIIARLNQMLPSDQNGEATLIEVKKDIQQHFPINCPHCESEAIIGNGNYRDRKRYKCKACGKTFNDLTGTSVSHIHKKNEWEQYISCISEGLSLREAASRTGISYRTSFLWRHKILGAFQDIGCTKLEGIVEGDETFFLYSEKGQKNIQGRKSRKRGGKASKAGINDEHVAVIVATDRNKHSIVEVAGRSRISSQKINSTIGKWIDEETVALCTDSHRSYEKFAKDRGLRHISVNASNGQHVKDKVYHIHNVNNINNLLKYWIRKFNGVASKYLQNYMNWFRIERVEKGNALKYLQYALTSNTAYVPANKINTHYFIS
jgi:transposase-like protein